MRSITLKLFLITAIVFGVLIGGMLLMQSAFFEDYYIQKKVVNVKSAATYITEAYTSADNPFNSETNYAVGEYAAKNGLTVFYTETDEDSHAEKSSIMVGSDITIQQQFFMEQIQYGKKLYEQNKPSADAGEILEYQTEDTYGNTLICTVSSVVSNGKSRGTLHIFSSLQPIGEAALVIKGYYIIFFAVALVLTIGLSILYSRQITKPMIHINRIAGQIANLDFSEECTYRSKDELGALSSTINKLSTNLSYTIQQLEESNKKLQTELDNAKKLEHQRTEFVAGVSHELKTPLSVIRGYVEKLGDDQPGDTASKKEAASIIISESEKMDRLISGMLELSSLEAGAVKLDKKVTSINRIIKYILKKTSDNMIRKTLSVNYASDQDWLVWCDAFRIEQVLNNLICNAVQYTPDNGYIDVRLTSDNNEVLCEIENGEVHLPEADISNIWSHFYRIEKSRNKDYGGVGLGLSIVKQILELHGSRYGVKNTTAGVLFYFTLPRCETESKGH